MGFCDVIDLLYGATIQHDAPQMTSLHMTYLQILRNIDQNVLQHVQDWLPENRTRFEWNIFWNSISYFKLTKKKSIQLTFQRMGIFSMPSIYTRYKWTGLHRMTSSNVCGMCGNNFCKPSTFLHILGDSSSRICPDLSVKNHQRIWFSFNLLFIGCVSWATIYV